MTHQSPAPATHSSANAGGQIAQLRHVLDLVEQIAERADTAPRSDADLDQNARISAAYEIAPSIVRRRFDAMAAETAAWAAIGVEALLSAKEASIAPRASAAQLADELSAARKRLTRLLGI